MFKSLRNFGKQCGGGFGGSGVGAGDVEAAEGAGMVGGTGGAATSGGGSAAGGGAVVGDTEDKIFDNYARDFARHFLVDNRGEEEKSLRKVLRSDTESYNGGSGNRWCGGGAVRDDSTDSAATSGDGSAAGSGAVVKQS